MNLVTLSASGHELPSNILDLQPTVNEPLEMPFTRVNANDLDLLLITTDEPDRAHVEQSGLDWDLISRLHQKWAAIHHPGQPSQDENELA